MSAPIYLDYAATTPVDPRVREALLPYLGAEWGNPSTVYAHGRHARRAMDEARDRVAAVLHARANEILFTGGGSESDNLALKGAALAASERWGARHVVTTAIEHHAVLHACAWLERHLGYEVTYVGVDGAGRVDPADVAAAVREDTAVVSVMLANNEVGTLEPVQEIARAVRAKNPRTAIHTDAVQAAGQVELDVQALGVDLLALSGHKVYAPKGVGVLYVCRGTGLVELISGGGQERTLRAGTENVAGIVGIARALELADEERGERVAHEQKLRDRLIAGVRERIPEVRLTGHGVDRLPNSASFAVRGAEGEALVLNLDQAGIYASSGSACTAGAVEESHVLRAMGLGEEWGRGSLRLTTGVGTTDAEIERVLDVLPEIVERVRELTPSLA